MTRVLHVVDDIASGVQAALSSWVLETPEFEHFVASGGEDSANTGQQVVPADRTLVLPTGHAARIRTIRGTIQRWRPDVIHAHSSIAGLYVRATTRSNARIVYSPHCFAFERQDVSRVRRQAYRLVEIALSYNTDTYVTVSQHEALLAQALNSKANTIVTTPAQASRCSGVNIPSPDRARSQRLVAGSGRITAQKNPEQFAQVAQRIKQERHDIHFLWIGDGDEMMRRRLETAGVEVTGWLARAAALNCLARADLVLHCATWEGSPVVVQEALDLRVPVVVRYLPVYDELDIPWIGRTTSELAAHVLRLTSSDENMAAAQVEVARICRQLSTRPTVQDQLRRAYSGVNRSE